MRLVVFVQVTLSNPCKGEQIKSLPMFFLFRSKDFPNNIKLKQRAGGFTYSLIKQLQAISKKKKDVVAPF